MKQERHTASWGGGRKMNNYNEKQKECWMGQRKVALWEGFETSQGITFYIREKKTQEEGKCRNPLYWKRKTWTDPIKEFLIVRVYSKAKLCSVRILKVELLLHSKRGTVLKYQ